MQLLAGDGFVDEVPTYRGLRQRLVSLAVDGPVTSGAGARAGSVAPPTLGAGRLVCVDGPAGSGKTTLAAEIASLAGAAAGRAHGRPVRGLGRAARVDGQLERLLRPLAEGRRALPPLGLAATRGPRSPPSRPGALLVLEGVGSGSAGVDELVTVLAWVEAPRDGAAAARAGPRRRGDAAALGAVAATTRRPCMPGEGTRARADLVLETSGPAGARA